MKTLLKTVFVVMVYVSLAVAVGCAQQVRKIGFLSDYSRLEPENGSLRYIDMKRLSAYDQFIIDPVIVHLHGTDKGPDMKTRRELANYMHNAIVNAIRDRYMVVSQPAPGVARLRIAITDVDKSTPALNVLPQTKLVGMGLGGASMEGELLDSKTGEQIGAVIKSQKGSRISLSGLKEWGDAKAVMDDWAERFRRRLDEAHGK
jgi:hypothetical protein